MEAGALRSSTIPQSRLPAINPCGQVTRPPLLTQPPAKPFTPHPHRILSPSCNRVHIPSIHRQRQASISTHQPINLQSSFSPNCPCLPSHHVSLQVWLIRCRLRACGPHNMSSPWHRTRCHAHLLQSKRATRQSDHLSARQVVQALLSNDP